MRPPEFQAVVLAAGKGSGLSPLTNSVPKPLLPVANKPLIWYSLITLQRAGFKDALVVVPPKCVNPIEKVLEEEKDNLHINWELVPLPPNKEPSATAHTLTFIANKITSPNIVVLDCNLICDFDMSRMLNFYRVHNPDLSILLASDLVQGPPPGEKQKRKPEKDLLVMDRDSSRVLFLESDADHDGTIPLSPQLIAKSIARIKGDLLPYLLQLQYSGTETLPEAIKEKLKPTETERLVQNLSQTCGQKYEEGSVRCLSYIPEKGEINFVTRCNTLGSYAEAAKQIGNDCLVGVGSIVGEKSVLKRSVVGPNCEIGEGVRIVNSVVMDHVRIADRANINNSILCHSAEVGEECDLKDCIVSTNKKVASGKKLMNENVGDISKVMEL